MDRRTLVYPFAGLSLVVACSSSHTIIDAAGAPSNVGAEPPEGDASSVDESEGDAGVSGHDVDRRDAAPSPTTCKPTSCKAQSLNCGTIPDACGGTIDCGGCAPSDACRDMACVAHRCTETTKPDLTPCPLMVGATCRSGTCVPPKAYCINQEPGSNFPTYRYTGPSHPNGILVDYCVCDGKTLRASLANGANPELVEAVACAACDSVTHVYCH